MAPPATPGFGPLRLPVDLNVVLPVSVLGPGTESAPACAVVAPPTQGRARTVRGRVVDSHDSGRLVVYRVQDPLGGMVIVVGGSPSPQQGAEVVVSGLEARFSVAGGALGEGWLLVEGIPPRVADRCNTEDRGDHCA